MSAITLPVYVVRIIWNYTIFSHLFKLTCFFWTIPCRKFSYRIFFFFSFSYTIKFTFCHLDIELKVLPPANFFKYFFMKGCLFLFFGKSLFRNPSKSDGMPKNFQSGSVVDIWKNCDSKCFSTSSFKITGSDSVFQDRQIYLFFSFFFLFSTRAHRQWKLLQPEDCGFKSCYWSNRI